jgi:Family of unknown function (DUF6228)
MLPTVTSAIIGSYETRLELTCHDRHPNGTPRNILARLDGPSLSASVSAYDDNYGALVDFFDDLAASWRGWDGERAFGSLEGDLDLRATQDGHIRLSVHLRPVDGPGNWHVHATVTIDPGEDISSGAADVRAMVEGP